MLALGAKSASDQVLVGYLKFIRLLAHRRFGLSVIQEGLFMGVSDRVAEITYHLVNFGAKSCNDYPPDKIRDMFEHAESLTDRAATYGKTIASAKLFEAADKLAEITRKMDERMKQGKSIAGDGIALCKMFDAVKVLNDWNFTEGSTTTEQAAKAFDELFGAMSHFMVKLGPPFKDFGGFFKQLSETRFFDTERRNLDPELRPNAHGMGNPYTNPEVTRGTP